MENPIIGIKAHKIIDSASKALPETVKSVDNALSGVLDVLGYPTSYLGAYAKYSLQKTREDLIKKLNGKNDIVSPPISLAAPLLQKCQFTADSEHLHALFANLLATSMTSSSQDLAHPAFTEIISQLTPEEAKILFEFPDTFPMCAIRIQLKSNDKHELGEQFRHFQKGIDYIPNIILYNGINVSTVDDLRRIASITDNFARLGLIVLSKDYYFANTERYSRILSVVKPFLQVITCPSDNEAVIVPQSAQLTDFGQRFLKACVF